MINLLDQPCCLPKSKEYWNTQTLL